MAANGRLMGRPVTGSVTAGPAPGSPLPLRAERMNLAALDSAPYWARKFARSFLAQCRGITTVTADTVILVVSELVTNAYSATGVPTGPGTTYSQRAGAPAITLSLRYFGAVLLIEVIDSSPITPHMAGSGIDAENGRGLMLVEALSAEWGHFPVPEGGKCVYCILPVPGQQTPARASDNARHGPAPTVTYTP